MRKWLALVAVLVLGGALGFFAAQPPAPLPATAASDRFAAGRAMADVRVIAARPHPTGSRANAAVRDYLVGRLRELGFAVRLVRTPLPAKARQRLIAWGGKAADTPAATSIVALRPGGDPASPLVMLMAHYDSVWASPGAPDDAAGVASILEIARAIPNASQARDLAILLTDGEEIGLVGARGFFAPPPAGDPLVGRIGALINLESRGGGGRAMMFESGPGNGEMVGVFGRAIGNPAGNSLAVKIYELLPNSTDFTPAKKLGIPGFNFAFLGDAGLYHSPLATPDALDPRALQHIGAEGLDATRALLTAPLLPAKAPDKVFSDVLGGFVLAHPPWLGWGLIAAAAALVIASVRRAPKWRFREVGAGAVDALVFTAATAVLLYAGNLLSGADGRTNYYDRLAALPRLEVQALCLAAAALAFAVAGARRSFWGGWLGVVGVNLIIALVVQALLPAAAPVFIWPFVLAVAGMALAAAVPLLRVLAPAAAAILGLAFLGGFAHFLMLGIGGPTPSAVAVIAPGLFLFVWPLLPVVPRRPALLAALVFALAGAGIALWVRLEPIAATVPPYDPRA